MRLFLVPVCVPWAWACAFRPFLVGRGVVVRGLVGFLRSHRNVGLGGGVTFRDRRYATRLRPSIPAGVGSPRRSRIVGAASTVRTARAANGWLSAKGTRM
jgi:hypothetical protein